MAEGLLGDVLPYIYGRSNVVKNKLADLLADPMGSIKQTAGGLLDSRREQQGLMAQAFSDPTRPFKPTNQNALAALVDSAMAGPMGFAPAGVIDVKALRAAFPNVDFSLSQRGDGATATLSKVVVPKAERGQGVGTEFMQALTKAADADRAVVALSPASDFGGNKARLVDFYRRFGFVPNKGRNIDYEISESMYRNPNP